MTNTCINCKSELEGPYCYQCGEKIVTENDFTIKKLLEQTVDVFTHLDSKIFLTLKFPICHKTYSLAVSLRERRKSIIK